jgi:ketosteroid isomerase-like protein
MRSMMKSVLILLLTANLCGVLLAGEASIKLQDEVLQAENARVQAVLRADVAALDPMLASDLTYCHSTGVVDSKSQFLAKIKSGELKYEAFQHRDQLVRIYGNTAVITGVTNLRLGAPAQGGTAQEAVMRFTTVYVKQNGRWQQVAWQTTRLPQP